MKLIALTSLVLFIIFISLVLPKKVAAYKLSQTREIVTVLIKELPDCRFGYKNKFIRISYDGQEYILRTSCKWVAGLRVGQSINMLHKSDTDLFLFPEEDTLSELLTGLIVTVMFAICSVYLFKKSG